MTIEVDRDILIKGVKDKAQKRIAEIFGTAFLQGNRGAVKTIPGDIAIDKSLPGMTQKHHA